MLCCVHKMWPGSRVQDWVTVVTGFVPTLSLSTWFVRSGFIFTNILEADSLLSLICLKLQSLLPCHPSPNLGWVLDLPNAFSASSDAVMWSSVFVDTVLHLHYRSWVSDHCFHSGFYLVPPRCPSLEWEWQGSVPLGGKSCLHALLNQESFRSEAFVNFWWWRTLRVGHRQLLGKRPWSRQCPGMLTWSLKALGRLCHYEKT